LAALTRQLADAKLISDSQEADINRISRLNSIANENYEMEVAALRDRNTRLTAAYDAEFALRQQHEEKALKFDRCNEDLKQLRREVRRCAFSCMVVGRVIDIV
jgi:hypothetical protein